MKPRILHLTITDAGGAGKAAYNVFTELMALGYPSQLLTLNQKRQEVGISKIGKVAFLLRKVKKGLFKNRKRVNSNYQMYGIDELKTYVSTGSIIEKIEGSPNVIFVYWVSGFLNAKNLYELSKKYNAAIVLSLTDMVSFTGGCHFALSCSNYYSGCGNCPGLYSEKKNDTSSEIIQFKNKYYQKTKMAVVVGTTSLKKQVEKSFLFKNAPNYLIRYHVDTDRFYYRDRYELRKKNGIKENTKILFFGATHIQQERKGFSYLKKSLERLKQLLTKDNSDIEILLLVAGNGNEEFCDNLPFPYHSLGFINNEETLAESYNIADIFLNTSIDDIGPFMMVEAMLCERLVVSYDVGFANDMIIQNETGFIAKNRNYNEYANQIFRAINLSKIDSERKGQSAREIAKKLHNWKIQPQQYEELFIDLGISETTIFNEDIGQGTSSLHNK